MVLIRRQLLLIWSLYFSWFALVTNVYPGAEASKMINPRAHWPGHIKCKENYTNRYSHWLLWLFLTWMYGQQIFPLFKWCTMYCCITVLHTVASVPWRRMVICDPTYRCRAQCKLPWHHPWAGLVHTMCATRGKTLYPFTLWITNSLHSLITFISIIKECRVGQRV